MIRVSTIAVASAVLAAGLWVLPAGAVSQAPFGHGVNTANSPAAGGSRMDCQFAAEFAAVRGTGTDYAPNIGWVKNQHLECGTR